MKGIMEMGLGSGQQFLVLNINILMRNAITSKQPPLTSSLNITLNLANTKSHFFAARPTKNLKVSTISECISRTIDQIQQKISDIVVEFHCGKSQQECKWKQMRKSLSSWLDEDVQQARREKIEIDRKIMKKKRERTMMDCEDCLSVKGEKNVRREENKQNRSFNHPRTKPSKEIMFGRTSLFWKENEDQGTESSLQDTCFSSICNSQELSQQISCYNFHSNLSSESRNEAAMPKILMKRRQRAQGNASEPERRMPVKKGQVKRLLSQLNHQIVLDEMLMTMKEWFSQQQSSKKWKQLQTQLRKQGIQIGQLGLKSIFLLNCDEESTFAHFSPDDYSIGDLARSFCAAEKNWQQSILHQFCPQSLKLQNFLECQLDLNTKGHISIEDLVFYINNNLHSFYQNRHLRLIFKRLKKTNMLHYKDLMTSLTKAQLT